MSANLGSIIAKMELNLEGFHKNIQEAQSQVKQTQKKFNAFDKTGEVFSKVGKTLMLGVTAPVVGLGTAVTNTASTFHSKMSNVKAISGATGEEFKALEAKAKEMGATTKFSASDSADAMSYMAMAGWKSGQMIDGLGGIMDLAAASGEDLGTVSDIVTDAMTAFGLQADQSGKFADVLASASANANTNVGMLGESFKYCAPVAGALGYSAEDTALALGLMANAGIKGSQGGTALRASLTRLISPTSESQKLMNKYGISLKNSDGSMKSLGDVMGMLRGKLGGLDSATQAQVASTLFGQEAMSGMLSIINASQGDYDKLSTAINTSEGSAKRMADTMNDNLNGKITLLKSGIEGLAIQLGDILIPGITNVVEKVTDLVSWFSSLDEKTLTLIVNIAKFGAGFGVAVFAIGKTIKTIQSINKTFKTMRDIMNAVKTSQALLTIKTQLLTVAQSALNFVMALNPWTLVIAGIVALIAVFVVLWNKCEGFRNFWIGLWDTMKECAGKLWDWLQEKASQCMQWIEEKWEGFKEWWSGFWEWLKAKPQELWDWIVNIFSTMWENIKAGWQSFSDAFGVMWENCKNVFTAVWESVSSWFSTLWDGMVNIVTTVVQFIQEKFSGMGEGVMTIFQGLSQFFSGIWEVIKNVFFGALLLICDLVTLDFEKLKTDAMNIWNNIKEGFSNIWEGIKNIFSGALDTILAYWSGVWETMKTIGYAIWEAISTFFLNTWTTLKESAYNIWTNVKEFFNTTWEGIKQTANTTWNNIKQYFKDLWQNMKQNIKETWNNIKQFFYDTWNSIGTSINNAWNGFKNTISNLGSQIKQNIFNMWNSTLSWLRELPSKLWQIGSDMFHRMASAISSASGAVYNAVVNGVNGAINWLKDLPRQALTWGRHMIEGFINGIKGAIGGLVDCVKGVGNKIRNFLGFSIPKMGPLHVYMEWMPHMIEGMTKSLDAHKHKLINEAQNIAGALSDTLVTDANLNARVTDSSYGSNNTRAQYGDVHYNINIDKVNANDPKDVRRLAEELEAFRNFNKI